MKFSQYSRQVNPNTIQGQVQRPGDLNSYGGNGDGYRAIGKGLGAVNEVFLQQMQADDIAAVLDASNAMNMELINFFNGENGILGRQGINAEGSLKESEDFINKTFGKYASKLGIHWRAQMLRQKFNPNAFNYLRSAASHERKQRQIADDNRFNTAANNNISGMLINYNDLDAMNEIIKDTSTLVQMRGEQKGWDDETIMRAKISAVTDGLKVAIGDAISKENYNSADTLLRTYKDIMEPNVYSELTNSLAKLRIENAYYETAYNIVDKCIGTDGYVDNEALNKMIERDFGPENDISEGIVPYSIPISSGDNPDLKNLNPKLKSSLDLIGGVLNQMGFGNVAEITSGYRDEERNAKAGGVSNSNHISGNAVDIYLGNINEAQKERLKKVFEPYFGEVIYHNAGSGDHLHLGEYKNNLRPNSEIASPFNPQMYKQIKQLAKARASDINNAKKQEIAKYKEDLALKINTAPTEEDAVRLINDSNLSNKEKISLIKAQREARNPSSYMSTADKAMWEYVNKGNYNDDLKLMEEYNRRSMDSADEITPAQQRMYNKAAKNLNDYYAWANPGYQTGDYKQDYSNNTEYKQLLSDIEYMAERGASKAEITEHIQEIAKENGFDGQYILDTVMWDKLGKIEGGIK
ncbi:D-Ala-D-Ala carboxypeptidase family metallohydrolase [Phascolarctobacterium sp.]